EGTLARRVPAATCLTRRPPERDRCLGRRFRAGEGSLITAKGDHSMHRHLSRRQLVGILVGAALLLLAATAFAAGQSIPLNLKGGYKNQTRVACTQRNHYTVYHRGRTLRMEGYISPAPALPDGAWRR